MAPATEHIFAHVLPLIRPAEKKLLPVVSRFLKQVNTLLKDAGINAIAVVGGSIAKGTFLKDDHDCDIFVKFHPSYPDEKLSELLSLALESLLPERVHGSRDYFHIDDKKHNLRYELVPVVDISDP
ncbi:nucleotidyltransferase domain-containing protein, partial [Candidatus Woesearchaeota archaeon]|nr:nucleotidyltransferase domain-containing protein [Candidatus Woesearchaeota archaeon]